MNGLNVDLSVPIVRWAVQSLIATGALSVLACIVCQVARRLPLTRLWAAALALTGCLLLPGLSWFAMQRGMAVVRIPVEVLATRDDTFVEPVKAAPVPYDSMFVDDTTSAVFESRAVATGSSVESSMAPTATTPPMAPMPLLDWRLVLLTLYGLGVAWTGARLLLGTARLARVLRSAGEPAPGFLTRLKLSGFDPDKPAPFFKVRMSDRVTSPLVAGVLRPSLLFPASFSEHLSPEEMRQIIAHEEEHARGRHALFGLLQRTTTIVLWFNPFVHVLANDLTRTLEELCDNAAIEHGSPSSFARLLVQLAEGQGRMQLEGLALGVLDDRISLERRVRGLLDPSRRTTKTMKPYTRFALVGTSILATLTLAGTQIVAAQSAWDDLMPSAQSRPDAAISAPVGTRSVKVARVQQRKADRQARKAQKANAKAARVRVAGGTLESPVTRRNVDIAPVIVDGPVKVARNSTLAEPKLSRAQVAPSTIVLPQVDNPTLAPSTVKDTPVRSSRNVEPITIVTQEPRRLRTDVTIPSGKLARRTETVTLPELSRTGGVNYVTVPSASTPGQTVIVEGPNTPKIVKGKVATVRGGQLAGAAPSVTTVRSGLSRNSPAAAAEAPAGQYVDTTRTRNIPVTGAAAAPSGRYIRTESGKPAQATVSSRSAALPGTAVNDAPIALPARRQPAPTRPVIASGTEVYTSPDHKPVTVIRGATVVIYEDGTTVITKSGKTTTVKATAKSAKARATTRKAKSVPKPPKPVARKVSK